MDIETVQKICHSFPHVTEDIQWQNDLLFRVGGKMFAVVALDPSAQYRMSFKCSPETFAELTSRPGIVPAPYVARYHWVALESYSVLPAEELKPLLKTAYSLVLEKLPKRVKITLDDSKESLPTKTKAKKRRGTRQQR